jgi:hypothetical protein
VAGSAPAGQCPELDTRGCGRRETAVSVFVGTREPVDIPLPFPGEQRLLAVITVRLGRGSVARSARRVGAAVSGKPQEQSATTSRSIRRLASARTPPRPRFPEARARSRRSRVHRRQRRWPSGARPSRAAVRAGSRSRASAPPPSRRSGAHPLRRPRDADRRAAARRQLRRQSRAALRELRRASSPARAHAPDPRRARQ